MQIFNTLTRQKEEFVPQVPGEYRIYVCGPTVYNYIHIGNARPLIVFDTLRRYLEYRGNKVIYVSNITDIDDKLIKKGQEEGTSMKEVAQRFEAEYLKDAAGLNCKKPTVQPRATEHIQQILDIVKDLIDSGHAYVAKNGDVYFRVKSDPEYGKLSHLKLDDLESGNRELRSQMEDDLKEDPADFAVWKAAKPGEPAWESPYGMGRPGWHIECSAMSRTHLGKTIDLHCGGQDLIFPHHENEIAQSECANGCEFARYWMHNGFINVDNQKMSKSLHNFFTVRDVANLYGYEPIRYFMLTAGYRMPLNYTVDLIESCKNSLERLYTCRENLDFALSKTAFGTDETLTAKADEARAKFCKAMDDDLNTPDALAAVFDLVKEINTLSAASSKAALEAAGRRIALAAPSFPRMGRTVDGGVLRLPDGSAKDLLALFRERAHMAVCHIPLARLRAEGAGLAADLVRREAPLLCLIDAMTEEDLSLAAGIGQALDTPPVYCGSAALAEALPVRGEQPDVPCRQAAKRVLVVTGSQKKELRRRFPALHRD